MHMAKTMPPSEHAKHGSWNQSMLFPSQINLTAISSHIKVSNPVHLDHE